MGAFIPGLLLALGLYLLLRSFLAADPHFLARFLRWSLISAGSVLTVLLILSERVGLLVLLAGLAMPWLTGGRSWRSWQSWWQGAAGPGNAAPRTGRTSQVKTLRLRMTLDHDSGALTGMVLSGRFAGTPLDRLDIDEQLALLEDCRTADTDSVAILEAWLDRTYGAAWRQRGGPKDDPASNAPPATSGPMSRSEALAILALEDGATPNEIKTAHRRLMAKIHPDHGGSAWLAAKLNQARDRLLERRAD